MKDFPMSDRVKKCFMCCHSLPHDKATKPYLKRKLVMKRIERIYAQINLLFQMNKYWV